MRNRTPGLIPLSCIVLAASVTSMVMAAVPFGQHAGWLHLMPMFLAQSDSE
jgi:hypothetical protein